MTGGLSDLATVEPEDFVSGDVASVLSSVFDASVLALSVDVLAFVDLDEEVDLADLSDVFAFVDFAAAFALSALALGAGWLENWRSGAL